MRYVKLIAINIGVFLCLIVSVNIALAVAFAARDYWFPDSKVRRAELSNYADQDWAHGHFREMNRLSWAYHSYYGWRQRPFAGDTITIEQSGLRRTSTGGEDIRIGFFGGSAMWGEGARDEETIPSLVAANLGAEAVNFGDRGWRAHQSLNRLFEAYVAGERFDVIVFYDGVNDVAYGCRAELPPFSHVRHDVIAERFEPAFMVSMRSFFAPIQRLTNAIARRWSVHDTTGAMGPFNCSRDPDKAAHVARMIAADWDMARFIAERMGARFIGALQPVSYISDTPLDHIDPARDGPLEPEFRSVYPLIAQAIDDVSRRERLDHIDMTRALDTPEPVYIDWVHLSPNGNAIIADHLSRHIRSVLAALPASDRERRPPP